ncbi:MAG: hypothetical protein ACRC2M_07490 [Planktothrix sp.]
MIKDKQAIPKLLSFSSIKAQATHAKFETRKPFFVIAVLSMISNLEYIVSVPYSGAINPNP